MIRHWHARGSILVSRPLFPSAGQPELIRPGGLGGFNWWKMVKLSGYGSIPINTSGGLTSINPSYFDVNKRGTRFWPIPWWFLTYLGWEWWEFCGDAQWLSFCDGDGVKPPAQACLSMGRFEDPSILDSSHGCMLLSCGLVTYPDNPSIRIYIPIVRSPNIEWMTINHI